MEKLESASDVEMKKQKVFSYYFYYFFKLTTIIISSYYSINTSIGCYLRIYYYYVKVSWYTCRRRWALGVPPEWSHTRF